MKKVIVFGTFDIFHKGHESFLRQARKHGDFLIVVVGRDAVVEKVKGKKPKNNEKERLAKIKELGLADKVVLGHLRDMYFHIRKYKPDVIGLGYDQTAFVDKLKEKLLSYGLEDVKIVRLRAYKPDVYKSSKMKK